MGGETKGGKKTVGGGKTKGEARGRKGRKKKPVGKINN